MVQPKHHKSKSKKLTRAKKHGKQADISDFRSQLDLLGLKIIQVTADGNCFFRALADQLEGNEEEHGKYRRSVVQYIEESRELFEPFIEDEVPFDEYCQSMGKDGTWAGHMELQAASLVTHNNICIHHHMSPRWYIRNFDNQGARMIHLAYHDGEHYNSVRLKEDQCNGPAKPIIIKADVNLTASSQQAKSAGAQSKTKSSKIAVHGGAIKMVIAGSGCDDDEKVEQILLLMDGDVDAAIECLIAEQDAGETLEENYVCDNDDKDDNEESNKPDKCENRVPAVRKDQSTDTERVDCYKTLSKGDKVFYLFSNLHCYPIPRVHPTFSSQFLGKFPEIRFALVDQRRNIRHVVEQLLERPILKFKLTMTLALGVKEGSTEKRLCQLPKQQPVNQMINCLIWVPCVSDLEITFDGLLEISCYKF